MTEYKQGCFGSLCGELLCNQLVFFFPAGAGVTLYMLMILHVYLRRGLVRFLLL